MTNRRTLYLLPIAFLCLAVYLAGCDSAPNPVAPTGATLIMTANPTKIARQGEPSTISIRGFKADGNPLNPGTLIFINTNVGIITTNANCQPSGDGQNIFPADDNGGVRVYFCGDGSVPVDGMGNSTPAEITASLAGSGSSGGGGDGGGGGGAAGATASVTVEFDGAPQLEISANPSTVPVLGNSTITIFARDSDGFFLGAGERILLTADLGSVPSEIETDADGRATARFRAGSQSGDGTVTARLDNAESASTTITIRAAVASVLLSAQPRSINRDPAGETITLTVQVRDAQGDPVGGTVVTFDTLGSLDQNPITTNSNGQGSATLTVTDTDVQAIPAGGTFTITASVLSEGNEITDTEDITVLN